MLCVSTKTLQNRGDKFVKFLLMTLLLYDIYTIQFLAEGINQSTAEAVGLKQALSQSLIVLLVPIILLGFACRFLKKDEDNLFEKARNLGEAI